MTPPGLRLALAAAAALSLCGEAIPAAAQVRGPCAATFNGVEAERIDSLGSPLLLDAEETLVFSGTDAEGTQNVAVAVLLGPATLDRESATVLAGGEFLVSLDLGEVAPNGVGLLRIRATTDHCTVEAWLRLGGRLPFTTLVGLTGVGLALAGLSAQVVALLARRRWSLPVATAAGVGTGAGGALLAQQFGGLQLSYPSIGAAVALAVIAGLGLALLRRRRGRDEVTHVERTEAAEPARSGTRRYRGTEPAPTPVGGAPAATSLTVAPEPVAATPVPAPRPAAAGPYWCYVMADVEVLHLDDYNRVVATLRPGTWYLAKREVSGWAQVVAEEGAEGWVPRSALHREG